MSPSSSPPGPKALRVAAYCRVSTDKEDQLHSLEAQRTFFLDFVRTHPQWSLVGIFADEGLSGTSLSHRRQLRALLTLARAGEVDLILTKEVSRFARNTVDTLQITRELRSRNVGVLFLSDGIDTREGDGEFRLSIMASVAQEESRKISQRTRWGQLQAMKKGVVFGNDTLYGYTLRHGSLTVLPSQAQVVRLIYHKCLQEGKGAHTIARELTQAGVAPPLRPEGDWSAAMVLRILHNEKYCGDLLQKKYWTADYLTHRKVRNTGQEEQFLLPDHHEAIVSRREFEAVQAELRRRAELGKDHRRFSVRYWYSGKLRCGLCGSPLTLKRTRRQDGTEYQRFVCRGRLEGRCGLPGIRAQVLTGCVRQALGILPLDQGAICSAVLAEAEQAAAEANRSLDLSLCRQRARRQRTVTAFLDGALEEESFRRMLAQCDGIIARLEAQAQERSHPTEDLQARLRPWLERELREGTAVLEAAVEQVTLYPDRAAVTFFELPSPVEISLPPAASPKRSRRQKRTEDG